MRLYDAGLNTLRSQYNHKAAVLDCCFITNSLVASGGLDKSVMTYASFAVVSLFGLYQRARRVLAEMT